MKEAQESEFEETAIRVKEICNKYDAVLIVNDNVEIAQKVQSDGIHLGVKDMLPSKARILLGPDVIIGGTANTLDDMLWCTEKGCDYIGLGPYRFTKTKKELSPIVGSFGMKDLLEAYSVKVENPLPIVAIGGITPSDVFDLRQLGYHGMAVSSAIAKAPDVGNAIKEFINELAHGTVTYS